MDGGGGAATTMQEPRPLHDLSALAAALVVCFGAAALGARFLPGPWYQAIAKPAWTPPAAVFGPVWTVLYAVMAVAAWRVWRRAGLAAGAGALALFGVQLTLNAAWSWLFFGLHRPGWAVVEILLLWAAIAATAIAFRRHDAIAAVLLLPYLGWVGFAAVLNVAIWTLNR